MDGETLYAARDRQGIRPLVLGRLERGERDGGPDIVGATFIREVAPGELIAVDSNGLRSRIFAAADPKGVPV
jgi:amidophosphoribosyltransferase